MEPILKAFQESLKSFCLLRVWLMVLFPPLLTLLLWGIGIALFWSQIANLVDVSMVSPVFIEQYLSFAKDFIYILLPFFRILWIVALLFLLLGLIFATSLLITSGIIIPALLNRIQKVQYPHLHKIGNTHFFKSFMHSLRITFEVGIIFVISLPLWVLPGISVLISGFLTGYLGAKVFPYEILSEYASPEEMKLISKKYRKNFIGVGMLAFLTNFFPLAFLFSPVFTALIFIHLCFDLLTQTRHQRNNEFGVIPIPVTK